MAPAFVTTFLGSKFAPVQTSPNTPRCTMGDSQAPVIKIKDTKSDQTSKVTVSYETIPPNVSDAIAVTSSVALSIALRSKTNASSPPADTPPCPPGVSPADHYFPASIRNTAPVISLVYNESISVSYDRINPSVAGVAADNDSVAFWKKPVYKYSAPETTDAGPKPEILSTAAYEKYFPTKYRNRAPFINLQGPQGDWDDTAYLEVGNEYVELNPELARQLNVSQPEGDASVAGSAAVSKYFGDHLHDAPEINITTSPVESVTFGMRKVDEPLAVAASILSQAGAA